MPATRPHTGTPELVQGPNQEIPANDAFDILDAVVQLTVKDRDLTAPPGSPSDGDRYIPAATATGDWVGDEGTIQAYYNGWVTITPKEGWRCRVDDEDVWLEHDGTNWNEVDVLGSVGAGIAAAGTTQGAGTALTNIVNVITSITAASAEAVVLPAAKAGRRVIIANDDGADTLKVFPASGDSIDSGTVDASKDLAAGKRAVYVAQDATDWLMVVGA